MTRTPPLARARAAYSSSAAAIHSLLGALALALLLVLSPGMEGRLRAQDTTAEFEPSLRVHLLTMDRGDEVWEMFGHNALLIVDETTGEARAWNWGLFNFEDVDFIPRFLRGTMRYTMGPADPDPFFESYRRSNRAVYANEILLTPEEAAELDAFVRWNHFPENRPYIYDYYRDNCSTRLRDALDGVLGGMLRARFENVDTGQSYRWYSRRLVQVTWWVDQGLSYLLGMRGDLPISAWEAMFLPMELMAYLEEVERVDPSGETRPLLGPRRVIVDADRPPLPEGPPGPSMILIAIGMLGAALIVVGARRASRASVRMLGTITFAWGLFAGVLGGILVSAWFTDHHFIHANLNVLHLNPLAPLSAILIVGALTKPSRAEGIWGKGAIVMTAVIAFGSVVATFLGAVGPLQQGNGDVVATALPINLALAWVAWRLHRPDSGDSLAPSPRRF